VLAQAQLQVLVRESQSLSLSVPGWRRWHGSSRPTTSTRPKPTRKARRATT